jgi:hypothetical protein
MPLVVVIVGIDECGDSCNGSRSGSIESRVAGERVTVAVLHATSDEEERGLLVAADIVTDESERRRALPVTDQQGTTVGLNVWLRTVCGVR